MGLELKGPSENVTLEYYHNLNSDSPEVYLDNLLNLIKNHLLCNPYMQDSVVFKLSELRLQISHSKPNLGGAEKDDTVAIRRMLEKLIKDGFVSEWEVPKDWPDMPENLKGERFWFLSYEGLCF